MSCQTLYMPCRQSPQQALGPLAACMSCTCAKELHILARQKASCIRERIRYNSRLC